MNDFSRLESKLAKLGQRERSDHARRRLTGATPEAVLAQIVAEVDEIILPRRLSLKASESATLKFAVANRRLQAILSPLPPAASAASDLADQPLSAGDDDTLAKLKTALMAVLEETSTLEVSTTRPAADQSFPGESGVPSGSLARAWDVSLEAPAGDAPDPVAALTLFLDGLDGAALAWLRIDGEDVTGQGGDTDMVQTLSNGLGELLDSFLQKRSSLAVREGAPAVIAFDGAKSGVLLVDHGSAKAVVSVAQDKLVGVMNQWRTAVGI